MALIKLNNSNLCAIVDDSDFSMVAGHTWSLHTKGYAYRFSRGKAILMHRLILGIVDRADLVSDHINHNRLDNRRSNLRSCNRSENQRNVRPRGKSKYLGVTIRDYHRKDGNVTRRAMAMIKTHERIIYLGCFRTEIEAARAYDRAARLHHGGFANLNFK